jgi:excisionase family DNA binding protein
MKTLFNEQVLTPQEAATRIGVSEQTIKSWTKKGLLNSWRVGTRLFVPLSAIEAMAESVRQ